MKPRQTRGKVGGFPLLGLIAILTAMTGLLSAYELITSTGTPYVVTWKPGQITMQLKLPASNGLLLDGSVSYNASVQAAMLAWNGNIGTVRFAPTVMPAGSNVSGNSVNEIVMASKVDGDDFTANTVAVTLSYSMGDHRVESDIVFNSAISFNSYRGSLRPGLYDIRRIAIHELGHVLGLAHPDEAGQTVAAIMNSKVTGIDSLQADDLTGIHALYGAPGAVPANDSFASPTGIELSGPSVTFAGTNVQATREANEPQIVSGEAGGQSVWWRWIAPAGGKLTVTTHGSNFDTMLAAYTGSSLGALTVVAANDDAEPPGQTFDPSRDRTSIITFDVTAGTTYRFVVDGWSGLFGLITLNLQFAATAGNPPMITSQPLSRTVTAGGSATFSVAASGTLLGYQWYFNGAPLANATVADLTLGSAQASNAGSYYVVVSSFYGSTTSNTVQLTVNPVSVPPMSSGGGGGGGGGAPSGWFLAGLALLCLGRRITCRKEA